MSILEIEFKERLSVPEIVHVETPQELREQHPLHEQARELIEQSRQEIRDILTGNDNRLLIVIGPCSLDAAVLDNGTPAAFEMSARILELSQDPFIGSQAKLVMRLPPAKPRTNLGIAGLEQHDLSTAHRLLTDIVNTGVPVAIEIMHERHYARFGDMISLAWLGARDIGGTLLRHAASAYPAIPLLLKNGEDGQLKIALEAQKTVGEPHLVELTSPDGRLIKVYSTGNRHTGLIARGGTMIKTPLDFEAQIETTKDIGMPLIIDAAHSNAMAHDDNFKKTTAGQLHCLDHIAQLKIKGSHFRGIMIESYLLEGRDDSTPGRSRTDPCISFEDAADKIITILKTQTAL